MSIVDWSDANCRTIAPESMQPEQATAEDVEQAKAVCGKGTAYECPLLEQCRQLALEQQGGDGEGLDVSPYGVHAGEWWGRAPKLVRACQWCDEPVVMGEKGGRPATYCGARCRVAAKRARDAAALSA